MISQIRLVASDDNNDLVSSHGDRVFNPSLDALKGLFVGNIVNNNSDSRVFNIRGNKRLESLLASGVPQLESYGFVVYVDWF